MVPASSITDRKQAGWSVGQAAWRLGITTREYREIEAGERWPKWDVRPHLPAVRLAPDVRFGDSPLMQDLGDRVVAALGEPAARELLEALERSDADRAALIGRLHVRNDAAWLAEFLMDLEDDVGEVARLRLIDELHRCSEASAGRKPVLGFRELGRGPLGGRRRVTLWVTVGLSYLVRCRPAMSRAASLTCERTGKHDAGRSRMRGIALPRWGSRVRIPSSAPGSCRAEGVSRSRPIPDEPKGSLSTRNEPISTCCTSSIPRAASSGS